MKVCKTKRKLVNYRTAVVYGVTIGEVISEGFNYRSQKIIFPHLYTVKKISPVGGKISNSENLGEIFPPFGKKNTGIRSSIGGNARQ